MSDTSLADLLIEELAGKNAAAVELAVRASLAVRVEPELLRALRLELPGADVSAEVDLWHSDLVDARSPARMVLRPDVAARLRERLTPAVIEASRGVVRRKHAQAPAILRLEEELVCAALHPDPGGAKVVEEALASVLAAMLEEPSRRENLSTWALRALPQLPPAARAAPAFWSLLLVSGAWHPLGMVPVEGEPPAGVVKLDPGVLSALGTAKVAVEWHGETLKLRPAEATDVAVVPAPATRPLVIEVEAGGAVQSRMLAVSGWTEIAAPGDTAVLRTIDGKRHEVHRIRPAMPPIGGAPNVELAQVAEQVQQGPIEQEASPVEAPDAALEVPEEWWAGCVVILGDGVFQSGYLVAPDVVVTAAEGLGRAAATGGRVRVLFPAGDGRTGEEREARILQTESDQNTALLRLAAPLSAAKPCELGEGIDSAAPLFALGFGVGEGPIEAVDGIPTALGSDLPLRQTLRGAAGKLSRDRLLVDAAPGQTKPGPSMIGGPVVSEGRVIGHSLVINHDSSTDRIGLVASPAAKVRGLVRRVLETRAELARLASVYEELRRAGYNSVDRVRRMEEVRGEMERLASRTLFAAWEIDDCLSSGRDGWRLFGITHMIQHPDAAPGRLERLLSVLSERRSRFEQSSALRAAREVVPHLERDGLSDMREVVERIHRGEEEGNEIDVFSLSGEVLAFLDERSRFLEVSKEEESDGPPDLVYLAAPGDAELLRQLRMFLYPALKRAAVTDWHVSLLSAGQDPESAVDAAVASARVVVLLVTPEYLVDPLCRRGEEAALARLGQVRVVPVYVRPIDDWASEPFGKLTRTPQSNMGAPVVKQPNRDGAWAEVAGDIRKVVHSIREPSGRAVWSPERSGPDPDRASRAEEGGPKKPPRRQAKK